MVRPKTAASLDKPESCSYNTGMVSSWSSQIARECLGRRARILDRVVSSIFNQSLAKHGLKMTQMTLLVAIDLRGPIAASDLGRALHIEKSTLSRNLKRIEEQGWVIQRGGLRLSAAGRKRIEVAGPDWAGAQAEVERLLSPRGAKALEQMVKRIH
jgi:DNA-binding MarR family transcriptional regulator